MTVTLREHQDDREGLTTVTLPEPSAKRVGQAGSFHAEISPTRSSSNFQRIIDTRTIIGYTREGVDTTFIMVITDPGGGVVTAFPGEGS